MSAMTPDHEDSRPASVPQPPIFVPPESETRPEAAIPPLTLLKLEDIAETLHALGWTSPNDGQWDGLRKFVTDLEALHRIGVRAHVAAETAGLRALLARLTKIVTEDGKFPYATPERVLDVAEHVFESYRRVTCNLQECVQKHGLGEGGERVDEIVCRELDTHTALIVKKDEALATIRAISDNQEADLERLLFNAGARAHDALALTPKDLEACVVVKRSEWERLTAQAEGQT